MKKLALAICLLFSFIGVVMADDYENRCEGEYTCTPVANNDFVGCDLEPVHVAKLESFLKKRFFLEKMLSHNKKYLSFSKRMGDILEESPNSEEKFIRLSNFLDPYGEFNGFGEAIIFKLHDLNLSEKELDLVASIFAIY